jgi:hypothetical protein
VSTPEGILKNTLGSFRSPNGGRRYLKGLFFEMVLADKSTVTYTLKDHDHEGYRSLYKLYMAERDPTEYRFATKYLEGWSHWLELCECSWFKPYLERWRSELGIMIQSEALVNIFEEAIAPMGKNVFAANKYLLEKGWIPKDIHTKGRPSKADVKKEAVRLAQEQDRVTEDFERLLATQESQVLN